MDNNGDKDLDRCISLSGLKSHNIISKTIVNIRNLLERDINESNIFHSIKDIKKDN